MSKKDDALKLALDALEYISSHYMSLPKVGCMALAAVEEALAEQPAQQEPVAFLVDGDLYCPEEIDWETLREQGHTVTSLYTSPPAQPSKPLTDEQFNRIPELYVIPPHHVEMVVRAIEAAHGIKDNT